MFGHAHASPGPKTHLFGSGICKIWKSGSTKISDFEKNLKDAHRNSVQIGCDTFPNGLVWFRFEAKPIWDKIQKHCKNAVIC